MWPCAMSGVSEPVAVEVGEERLGLACVRVTVEHSSYKRVRARQCVRCFSPPPSLAPRPPATRCHTQIGRNRNRKWCLLFFSHTTYFFFNHSRRRHTARPGPGHTHHTLTLYTHSLSSLFCTTHARHCGTHASPRLTGTHAPARGRPHMHHTIINLVAELSGPAPCRRNHTR